MLVLGIETSSQRGSVALIDRDELLLELSHNEPNAHAERLIVLVGQLFAKTGRSRSAVARIAVGTGPGSFTGLRVGIALAQGISLGLGVPLFGVPSLRSLAYAATHVFPGPHLFCPMLDARRGEAFVAAFDEDLNEVLPVRAVGAKELPALLPQLLGGRAYRSCGVFATQIDAGSCINDAELVQYPSAVSCARLGALAPNGQDGEVVPLYVRPPDAVLPKLPPNPLNRG